jgi:hypothetical protein
MLGNQIPSIISLKYSNYNIINYVPSANLDQAYVRVCLCITTTIHMDSSSSNDYDLDTYQLEGYITF